MRVLLTSAGLETEEIKECFVDMAGKDMSFVKALFIPTAAIDAGAIGVLPKCMNDLLKCGILDKNIDVYDLHAGMEFEKLQQYDVVYFCHGQRIKFRVCDCNTKHNAQYPVHAVPIYRNRAICKRPCRLYAVNDTIYDHRSDRTGTVYKLCD